MLPIIKRSINIRTFALLMEKIEEEIQEGFIIRDIIVDPGQSPMRIDLFVLSKLERITRSKVQAGIKAGAVLVDEKQVKPNFKVKPGQHIKVLIPESVGKNEEIIPEDIPLDIVYEDDYLMVVNKPSGMVVHPGFGNTSGTLVNALAFYLGSSDGPILEGNGKDRPGLVHRIDKDTSGLLVIAKDDFSLSHLAKQFFNHTSERTYQAIVWGSPDPTEGTVDEFIGRHPNRRQIMTVFEDRDQGKQAITHFRILEDLYYISLIECKLETGRTHQIRVHMKYLGHPLFNDITYGGDRVLKGTVFSKYKSFVENNFKLFKGQALHAATLAFDHPMTGERMEFTSELPEEFVQSMERWRIYVDARKTK